MNMNDIIVIVFSSTLLAATVTSIFNLLTNKRKESIENIVKERKTWRDEMRKISLSISKSRDIPELQIALSELKVRINAYGLAHNSIFADSHIWEQIFITESMESISSEEFVYLKQKFVSLISCLLKYDWERAKAEIKGSMQTKVVYMSLIISYLLYSLRWFYNFNIECGKIMNFLSYTTFFGLFSAFALLMINLADKWRDKKQFYLFVFVGIIGEVTLFILMYVYLPSASPHDFADWVIRLAPFIALIYSSELKLLTYRRNINHFILSSALSCGATKIHKKYKVFFSKKDYTNLLTGETITFDEFQEIIALRATNYSSTKDEIDNGFK